MKKIKIKIVDNPGPEWVNLITSILGKKYTIEFSSNPDFVFAGPFGYDFLKYDCIRIFVTGENVFPDFNLFDYAIGFHKVKNADRYLRIPLYVCYSTSYELSKKERKNIAIPPKFCNFIYSNFAAKERIHFFEELNKYQKVDSGGSVKNNIGFKVKDKISFLKDYRFTIAFENEKYPGYVTEKLVEAFAANSIPIYYGADKESLKEFNDKSYIYIENEKDIPNAIDKIKEINENPALLKKYLNEPVYSKNINYEEQLEKFLDDIITRQVKKRPDSKVTKFYEKNMQFFGKIMNMERRINSCKIVQKIKERRKKKKWQ